MRRKIIAPIQQIAYVADQVSQGDLMKKVVINSSDEIGQLVKSFEAMVASLKQLILQIKDSAKNVRLSLEELSASTAQSAQATNQVADVTSEVAQGAEKQANAVKTTGKVVGKMLESINQVTEQSQESAKQIALLITEVQNQTDNAVISMDNRARKVKVGAGVVNNAGQAFKGIVELVSEVSLKISESSATIQQMSAGNEKIVQSIQDIDQISQETVYKCG